MAGETLAPFAVAGNLYYVGTEQTPAHLIDSGEGLILVDSGYDAQLPTLLAHIRALGYDPGAIRYILHTHGHLDHMGATRRLAQMTGAKTAIGRQDRDAAAGQNSLSYAAELGMTYDTPFVPDLLLDDGTQLTLGRTTIRCVHTPGHTAGAMSYLFYLDMPGPPRLAGIHGGIGVNTLTRAYLARYGLPLSLRADFRAALRRLRRLPVDVLVPNHQDQWDTSARCRRRQSGEEDAFVDAAAWPAYLDMAEARLDELLKREDP